jgi:hypothetical protein
VWGNVLERFSIVGLGKGLRCQRPRGVASPLVARWKHETPLRVIRQLGLRSYFSNSGSILPTLTAHSFRRLLALARSTKALVMLLFDVFDRRVGKRLCAHAILHRQHALFE